MTVRLKERERDALVRAAEARAVTPATWLRSLAVAHLGRRPQWTPSEEEALRALFVEVRRIGQLLGPEPECRRVLVRVRVLLGLRRAPRVQAGRTGEHDPHVRDRRRAVHFDHRRAAARAGGGNVPMVGLAHVCRPFISVASFSCQMSVWSGVSSSWP